MIAGASTPWSIHETERLNAMIGDGVSVRLAANRLGRTQEAVKDRLSELRRMRERAAL